MTDSAAIAALFICREPRNASWWRLGPLPPPVGRMTLLGWRQTPPSPDAGVPSAAALVLARALTNEARVSFPCSSPGAPIHSQDVSVTDDHVVALAPNGLFGRMSAALGRLPDPLLLRSTRRPESVVRLFDDPQYPWWLQGQVALLSAPDALAPACGPQDIFALLDAAWAQAAAALCSSTGVVGVLRPGVDGDVAGLLTFDPLVEEALIGALKKEARLLDSAWAVLDEDDFAQQLAGKKT